MNSHNAIPGTSSGPPAIPTQAAPIDVFTMTLHVRYLINRFTDPLQMSHFNGKFSDSVMLLLVVMMNHESASSFDRVKIKMMVTIKTLGIEIENLKLILKKFFEELPGHQVPCHIKYVVAKYFFKNNTTNIFKTHKNIQLDHF